MQQKEIAILKRRSKQAEALLKRLDRTLSSVMKLPSFKGKANLYDTINVAKMHAHNLSWDFKRDIEDLERAIDRK